MTFNNTFIALLNEAQFAKEMLGSGATQIRNANYSSKGIYFQSFTALSTGLERIGKLCLILDYYIDSNGNFPNLNYMKNSIRHNINVIYQESLSIVEKQSYNFEFTKSINREIHQNILKILSDFAKGDRYSNINAIVSDEHKDNPIKRWYETVDKLLFEKHVSLKKKEEILYRSQKIHQLIQGFTMVRFISEDGNSIENVQSASYQTGMQESVSPYRQLYVLQIIRFWVELIFALQYDAMKLGKEDIPFLTEIFGLFFNEDSYFKTRKTWNAIR